VLAAVLNANLPTVFVFLAEAKHRLQRNGFTD
jgi:hypothetical protein